MPVAGARREDVLALAFFGSVALGAIFLAFSLFTSWGAWLGQLTLPFAVNSWSDGPLLVQIDRIAHGQLPYNPVYRADSFTYGPAYLYVLAWLDRVFQSSPSIVPLRFISTALGMACCIPIWFALAGLRRRNQGTWRRVALLGTASTLLAYLMIEGRDPTFLALHPNPLAELLICTSIACVVWYPLTTTRMRPFVFALLLISCYVCALTKLNSTPLVLFFLAALVIDGGLTIRRALAAAGGFLLALGIFYRLIPDAERAWTVVVPAFHWFRTPWFGIKSVLANWFLTEPWQGVLVIAVVALLTFEYHSGQRRKALGYATILAGLFLTGFVALLKVGGGPYDMWWLYPACLLRLGAFVEAVLVSDVPLPLAPRRLEATVAIFALALPLGFSQGNTAEIALSQRGRAELAQTASTLAALCRPGYRIMVTWFPDPLLRCPNATFEFWDSVEEITWARPRGYDERIVMDDPISPDAFVMFREEWFQPLQAREVFPFNLRGQYRIVTLPVYEPIASVAPRLHLDVFMKKSSYR